MAIEVDIDEKVEKGWIHVRFSIEVQGNDKKHIEDSLKKMVEGITKHKSIMLISKTLDTTAEISKGWYSNFIEVEALVKGFDGLVDVATQLSPTTMEVLAPKVVKIPANQLQTAMIDISSLISTFAHAAYLARKELKKTKE